MHNVIYNERYECPFIDGKCQMVTELQGHKLNMFSTGVQFRGVPARAKFTVKNISVYWCYCNTILLVLGGLL